MKNIKLVYFVLVLLFVGCGENGCEIVSCSTVAEKPTAYSGDPGATRPYIVTGTVSIVSCNSGACDYTASLGPIVHNPLQSRVHVDIDCRYFFDGAMMGHANFVDNAAILANSSRRFRGFDFGFNTAHSIGLHAECCADFGTAGSHCDTSTVTK